MEKDKIKDLLLGAGVSNLKEYGYAEVTKENILTDNIYSRFFKSALNENKGSQNSNSQIDGVIDELIMQIDKK